MSLHLGHNLLLVNLGISVRDTTFCHLLSSFGLPPEPQSPSQNIDILDKHWHPNKDREDLTVSPFALRVV